MVVIAQPIGNDFFDYKQYETLAKHIKPFFKKNLSKKMLVPGLYIFFISYQFFQITVKICPIKLKNGMLYHMNNTKSFEVWSGNNSKWIATVKLHVKRSMYSTLFSHLYFCCNTWLDLQNLYQIFEKILVEDLGDGTMPCFCVVNGLVWHLLHLNYFLIIFFAICCRLEMQ